MSWRRPNLNYMRNEIHFYMVEYLNATITPLCLTRCLTSRKGKTADSSSFGVLRVDSRLSQMPEVAVPLMGADNVESIRLHQCVDRARFHSSKTLQFVPLDGVFDVGEEWRGDV